MSDLIIREARQEDSKFVIEMIETALEPYYGGDHKAHAERILKTHLSGGKDNLGFFSLEQKMWIIEFKNNPSGLLHLVGKRQGTYKISPIIISPEYRGKFGLGSLLLNFGETYAQKNSARQIYCTVAKQNSDALQFFLTKGYIIAGSSDSHYKLGIIEIMLYKPFFPSEIIEDQEKPHISVSLYEEKFGQETKNLLLKTLPQQFKGIDETWVNGLIEGFNRRESRDVNLKYKIIFLAIDRSNTVLGIAGATPKKGQPIKIMPFFGENMAAFKALLVEIPYLLREYGHKLYIHIVPTVEQTIALQQRGWKLDAALPGAYHEKSITQQWSIDIRENIMRIIRVKNQFLRLIKLGKKKLEVRVGYDSIKTIYKGERIKFASHTDDQIILVKDIRKYSTFEEMLKNEDPDLIAPGKNRIQVMQLLQEIYPPNRESIGVVVIEIALNP